MTTLTKANLIRRHRYCWQNVDTGLYLQSFDPDFVPPPEAPRYPNGLALWTDNIEEALTFASPAGAFACRQQQSNWYPFRPDGEPNRPLTALTLLLKPVVIAPPADSPPTPTEGPFR
jgi:hypothetical protein